MQATGDKNYLEDATDFYQLHIYNEGAIDAQVIFNWVTYYWGVNVLLAQTTNENTFHEATQSFLQKWVCAIEGVRLYPIPSALALTARSCVELRWQFPGQNSEKHLL